MNLKSVTPVWKCLLSFRGHKRKHSEEEEEEDVEKEEAAAAESSDESSKDSNEEEGSSSSEADEMAAALEAELNDFIWSRTTWTQKISDRNVTHSRPQHAVPKVSIFLLWNWCVCMRERECVFYQCSVQKYLVNKALKSLFYVKHLNFNILS